MRRGGGLGDPTYFDSDVVRRQFAAAGLDADIAEQLLSSCEHGAVLAINDKGELDGEPQ